MKQMYQDIIFDDDLNQRLKFILNINGELSSVFFELRWQKIIGVWIASAFRENGEVIALNVPVLSGITKQSANLLKPFAYEKMGELYVLPKADEEWGIDPTEKNLVSKYSIIWGDENE